MFCLVTDLMDCREYPAAELAALYKWRWEGSETALREAKASLRRRRAGHRADAPLGHPRPGPGIGDWATGNEMTRGAARASAHAAVPVEEGTRAGCPSIGPGDLRQPHPPRRDRRDPRRENRAARRWPGNSRNTGPSSRNRHRARQAKCAGAFPRAGRGGTATRTAPAVITLANTPA